MGCLFSVNRIVCLDWGGNERREEEECGEGRVACVVVDYCVD